jgi:CIC family chloride channel protein
MVGAATGAPLTGILLVFEMTDDYALMLPLMMATAVAMVVARRLEPDDLYRGWLRRRGVHLEHGVDAEVLRGRTVADVMNRDIVVLPEDEPVQPLLHRFAFSEQTVFPVVDERRRLIGVLTHRDLSEARDSGTGTELPLLAIDITQSTEAVTLEVPLIDVARRLGALGIAALPVVDAASGRVLGLIGRESILGRYGNALADRGGALGNGGNRASFP